jgi:hypothetical protein
MRVKAMRGVCVGVEDNLKEGDVRDLDPATADYLKNIGAAVDASEEVAGAPAAEAKPALEEEKAAAAPSGEASAAAGDEPAA